MYSLGTASSLLAKARSQVVETPSFGHLVDPARWLHLPAVEREVGGSNLAAVKGWFPDFPIGDLLRWGGQTLMQAIAVQ